MNNDYEFMCDEDKSYYEWVSNNIDFLSKYKISIPAMKKIYKDGFAAGFVHKLTINAKEQLQK